MRAPSATDFKVTVDGIGDFMFARRGMRDEIKINVEFSKYLEGLDTPTDYLVAIATWLSVLRVLMVGGPEGWTDMDAVDPLEEDTYDGLLKIYAGLRNKEDSFRRSTKKGGAEVGSGDGANSGVLVPSKVPAPAD